VVQDLQGDEFEVLEDDAGGLEILSLDRIIAILDKEYAELLVEKEELEGDLDNVKAELLVPGMNAEDEAICQAKKNSLDEKIQDDKDRMAYIQEKIGLAEEAKKVNQQ